MFKEKNAWKWRVLLIHKQQTNLWIKLPTIPPGLATERPESQQPTGSQIIRICMEIYLKIDKMVKMDKNSY